MDKLSVAREALEKCLALIDDMSRFVGQMSLKDYALFNEAPMKGREALAALAQPAPDGVRFTATVGIRRQTKSIDSLAELLRLINGGATLADIRIATPTAALTPAPQPAEGAEPDVQFEVWEDDMMVASSTDEADARRYFAVYSQDGPVRLVRAETTRTEIEAAAIRGGAE